MNQLPRCCLWALLVALACYAQSESIGRKLDPLIQRFVEKQEIPGLAIAVVADNRVAYAKGFGVKDLRHPQDPVTPRSLFHMASVTKVFVGTAIVQLAEKGQVNLDAPVVKYVPYFHIADPRYKAITVRQMLMHTAGMPDVWDYEWDKPQTDDGALERYVRSLTGLKLLFAPGSQFQYSNIAYEVLGDLIAKVSGMTFEDYVKKRILTPLQMNDSDVLLTRTDPRLMTWGSELDDDLRPRPAKVFPYNRAHSPSSDLHSNVGDMAQFALANLNRGQLGNAQILKSTSYDAMWKAAPKRPAALGWFVDKYRDTLLVSHDGGDTGYASQFALLPDKKIAVVWMANSDWLTLEPLTHAALDAALGLDPPEIEMKRSVAQALGAVYAGRGVDAAIEQYWRIKKLRPELYYFADGELDALGRALLREGKTAEAIRLLQLNVEEYPSSSKARASLDAAKALQR